MLTITVNTSNHVLRGFWECKTSEEGALNASLLPTKLEAQVHKRHSSYLENWTTGPAPYGGQAANWFGRGLGDLSKGWACSVSRKRFACTDSGQCPHQMTGTLKTCAFNFPQMPTCPRRIMNIGWILADEARSALFKGDLLWHSERRAGKMP